MSELDSIMHVRLTNISDLVASEGKYHLSCWIQFQRKVNKIKDSATIMHYGKQKSQQSFYRLCCDLISGLGSGHICDMGNVWVFYEHVNRIIPDSLSLLLEILLGGTDVFEQLLGKAKMHKSTSNIAQDIIYEVSKGTKLTPKHIGLGLTLYQATRSEKLVGLFHAAGHTIGIDTMRRFDTSIATDILNRYEENDNV